MNLPYYAKKYELPGSGIKETALNSAYLAAAQGTPINGGHIKKALGFYFKKMGMI